MQANLRICLPISFDLTLHYPSKSPHHWIVITGTILVKAGRVKNLTCKKDICDWITLTKTVISRQEVGKQVPCF